MQVPVVLCGGRVVECQPLSHHASPVCGLNAALQSKAGEVVSRARRRNIGLRVEQPYGLQRQVQHLVGELFRRGRRSVQNVADPGHGGREQLEYRPWWVSRARGRQPLPEVTR